MKYIIISLGGSLIIPKDVDYNYLKKFKKLIQKISKRNKIVIVTGGGTTARKYIAPLRKEGLSEERCSLIGIEATKLNAFLVSNFLNANKIIPDSIQAVKKNLKKQNVVVCGALGYHTNMTSDGDSAMIARALKGELINLTNVDGLYTKNPKTNRNAKLIPRITLNDFYKIANKMKYKAGQHFVLDQSASKIIKDSKIKTIILNGYKIKNLENYLKGKKFKGTIIS